MKEKKKRGRGRPPKPRRRKAGCALDGVVVKRAVDVPVAMGKQIEMIARSTGLGRVTLYRYGVQLVIDAYERGSFDADRVREISKPLGRPKKIKVDPYDIIMSE